MNSHVWSGSEVCKVRSGEQNRSTVLRSGCCSDKFCRQREVKRECGTGRERERERERG